MRGGLDTARRVPCPLSSVTLKAKESPSKPGHARQRFGLHSRQRGAVRFGALMRATVTAGARSHKPARSGHGAKINRQPAKRNRGEATEAVQSKPRGQPPQRWRNRAVRRATAKRKQRA